MLNFNNITFGYTKGRYVLENFSLELSEGGVYGLLGKNGTGKSTLLYLAMGLLRAETGSITYNGIETSLRKPEVLENMFIVPEEYNLPSIKMKDYINTIKRFYPRFDNELLNNYLDIFEMSSDINLGRLSMGHKKKVHMCIALAARTSILLMDEPTNGLDIPSKNQFRQIINQHKDPNQIIVISTHQVRDVEMLLDNVIMIEKNKVLLNSRMSDIYKNSDDIINLEELFTDLLAKNKGGISDEELQ